MDTTTISQRIHCVYVEDDYLATRLNSYLLDRKTGGLAKGSLRFYEQKLQLFSHFCDSQAILKFIQIREETFWLYFLLLVDSSCQQVANERISGVSPFLPLKGWHDRAENSYRPCYLINHS